MSSLSNTTTNNHDENDAGGASSHDEFLRSMTFASSNTTTNDIDGMCGCDECGPFSDEVPATIRQAVNDHLRKRKLEQQNRQLLFDGSRRLHIRQNRALVKREGGFSLWRFNLPLLDGAGDPIVEYRNNHRILFIKHLNKVSNVYSIGEGIIGSAAEEGSRIIVHWKEGCAYLLPHCQGIACGWIPKLAVENEKNDDATAGDSANNKTPFSDISDVVIYSLKVSTDTLSTESSDLPADASSWVRKSHELFHRCLANIRSIREANSGDGAITIESSHDDDVRGGIELSNDESLLMSEIIVLVGG